MDTRSALVHMLRQLFEDTQMLHQQGAGYYSCTPIARRYNKLLDQAGTLFAGERGLIDTFDRVVEVDPHDPADKMVVLQGIRIEMGQLISLLDALPGGDA